MRTKSCGLCLDMRKTSLMKTRHGNKAGYEPGVFTDTFCLVGIELLSVFLPLIVLITVIGLSSDLSKRSLRPSGHLLQQLCSD